MATLPIIRLNPDAEIRLESINAEHNYVIVDDFVENPQVIVDFAYRNADAFSIPENSYPGPLFDVAQDAMTDIYRFIRRKMSRYFPFLRGGVRLSTYLSMATLQPDELSNLQRLCHTDPRQDQSRRNYAGLIYLFENEQLGGTGFYRWKNRKLVEEATALELANPEQALQFLQENFPTYREPATYMSESNEIAELLGTIPARYNRMVFYSGDIPHSAAIAEPQLLSKDFRSGRLTLNCFASVLPK